MHATLPRHGCVSRRDSNALLTIVGNASEEQEESATRGANRLLLDGASRQNDNHDALMSDSRARRDSRAHMRPPEKCRSVDLQTSGRGFACEQQQHRPVCAARCCCAARHHSLRGGEGARVEIRPLCALAGPACRYGMLWPGTLRAMLHCRLPSAPLVSQNGRGEARKGVGRLRQHDSEAKHNPRSLHLRCRLLFKL